MDHVFTAPNGKVYKANRRAKARTIETIDREMDRRLIPHWAYSISRDTVSDAWVVYWYEAH